MKKSPIAFIYAHRRLSLAAAILLCTVAAFMAWRANYLENIFDILPDKDPEVQAHIKASSVFKNSDSLFFSVSDDVGNAAAAAESLAKNLSGITGIQKVECDLSALAQEAPKLIKYAPLCIADKIPEGDYASLDKEAIKERFERLSSSLKKGDFASAAALKTDPVGLAGILAKNLAKTAAFGGANIKDFKIYSPDGSQILLRAYGSFPCSDSAKSAKLVKEVREAIERTKEKYPELNVRWTGGYRLSAANAAIASSDAQKALFATMAAVFAICLLSFRNVIFAPLALIPSAAATLISFAAAGMFFGDISSISVAFASLAIGASVDYAVHILWRAGGLRRCDLNGVIRVSAELKLPIFVAAGTTAAAFAILGIFGPRGFAQAGTFGAIGIAAAALISVYALPAFLVGYAPKGSGKKLLPELFSKFARTLASSRLSVPLAIAATVAAAAVAPRLKFDGNLSSFNAVDKETSLDNSAMRKTWGKLLNVKSVFITADSLGELLARNEELKSFMGKRGDADLFGASTQLVTPEKARKNSQLWRKKMESYGVRKSISEACAQLGLREEGVLRSALALMNPPDDVSSDLFEGELGKLFEKTLGRDSNKYYLSATFSPRKNYRPEVFARQLREKIDGAHLIDADYMGMRISEISLEWLVKFAVISIAAATVYLLATIGFAGAVAVMVPVMAGLLWSLAAMGALSISINPINSIFVVFAVCMAQDYAVFIFNCSKNSPDKSSAYKPMSIACTTTLAAFGILACAQHPALNKLGSAAAISITCILISSLVFAPRLSDWMLSKNGK